MDQVKTPVQDPQGGCTVLTLNVPQPYFNCLMQILYKQSVDCDIHPLSDLLVNVCLGILTAASGFPVCQ